MFTHSRLVVVDDKQEHIRGIKEALDFLRYDCHSKLYEEETVAGWLPLPGIRILFVDKNLRAGITMGGGQQSAFAAILEVITKLVSPDSGPYGLILWAEQPDFEAFKTFLFERLATSNPELLPVFCDQLRKGDYIDTTSGNVRDAARLRADIMSKMTSSPQMKALFSWEADVVAAMDAVLKSVVELVPANERSTAEFSTKLGHVLYRLSQAGSGIHRALEEPRAAINRVLVPILADRITEHDPEGDAGASWKGAVIKHADPFASVPVQAGINSAIHASFAKSSGSVTIQPSDLGAVVKYPFDKIEESLKRCFGIDVNTIQNDQFFGMIPDDWKKSRLCLVQIGASCDHAQPKSGPLLYLLGLEWQYATENGAKSDPSRLYAKKTLKSDLEWRTPTLLVGNDLKPGKISVFLNCTLSAPREAVKSWEPICRFREELVSKLTQEYARHISRPGILTLSPDN